MGIFSKSKKGRKSDTIDFTKLEKKGIVKPVRSNDTIDLTNNSSSSDTSSAFGFLGNLACASTNTIIEEDSGYDSYTSLSDDKKEKLRIFLRNLRGKTQDNSNKIQEIIDRLEVLERRFKPEKDEY